LYSTLHPYQRYDDAKGKPQEVQHLTRPRGDIVPHQQPIGQPGEARQGGGEPEIAEELACADEALALSLRSQGDAGVWSVTGADEHASDCLVEGIQPEGSRDDKQDEPSAVEGQPLGD